MSPIAPPYGFLVVNIDDVLILTYDEVAPGLAASIQALWKTAAPSRLTNTQELELCGLEVRLLPSGELLVHQTRYVAKLSPSLGDLPRFGAT